MGIKFNIDTCFEFEISPEHLARYDELAKNKHFTEMAHWAKEICLAFNRKDLKAAYTLFSEKAGNKISSGPDEGIKFLEYLGDDTWTAIKIIDLLGAINLFNRKEEPLSYVLKMGSELLNQSRVGASPIKEPVIKWWYSA